MQHKNDTIIHCGECEFYKKNRHAETGWCDKGFMETDISEDDFCSRAEMRSASTSIYADGPVSKFNIPLTTDVLKNASESSMLLKDFAASLAKFRNCGWGDLNE